METTTRAVSRLSWLSRCRSPESNRFYPPFFLFTHGNSARLEYSALLAAVATESVGSGVITHRQGAQIR